MKLASSLCGVSPTTFCSVSVLTEPLEEDDICWSLVPWWSWKAVLWFLAFTQDDRHGPPDTLSVWVWFIFTNRFYFNVRIICYIHFLLRPHHLYKRDTVIFAELPNLEMMLHTDVCVFSEPFPDFSDGLICYPRFLFLPFLKKFFF